MTSQVVVEAVRSHLAAGLAGIGPVVNWDECDPLVATAESLFFALEADEAASETAPGIGSTVRRVREEGLVRVHLFYPMGEDLDRGRELRDRVRDLCRQRQLTPDIRVSDADPEARDTTRDRRWHILTVSLSTIAELLR